MASFEEFQTTIIADCKLLYVRSDEDHDRFMKLRDTISTHEATGKCTKSNRESRIGAA